MFLYSTLMSWTGGALLGWGIGYGGNAIIAGPILILAGVLVMSAKKICTSIEGK